jgi:phosphoribosylaminoimidazole (AIR) synthetase
LASSGVHSNGFSLVRKILAKSGASLHDPLPGADGVSIGEALLAPTVIYVKQVLEIVAKGGVKGIAHITGGGFTDNIPRIFPPGLGAFVNVGSWDVLPIFSWLQEAGNVQTAEMFRTFNMGIGMTLIVAPDVATEILSTYSNATLLGNVVEHEGVTYSSLPSSLTPKLDSSTSQRREPRQIPDKTINDETKLEAEVKLDPSSELMRRTSAMSPGIGGFCGLFPLGGCI